MRRIFVVLIGFIVMISSSYANGNVRNYKRLIKEFGIDTTAMKASSVEDFWNTVWVKNERLYKFYKAIEKKKSLAIKANDNVNNSLMLAANYFDSQIDCIDYENAISILMNHLGANSIYSKTRLFVIDSSELNAFSTPDGRIYLTTGLLNLEGMNLYQTLGVCAHEFAHFLLQHAKLRCYYTLREDRNTKIIAGVTIAAQSAASLYAASNGVKSDSKSFNEDVYNMFESAALHAQKFRYKYSREQEIEADIIACMFLEYLGLGGERYIEALELIKDPLEEYLYDSSSDHPTTSFRIGLLRYMLEHPEIVRDEPDEYFE